MKTHTTVTLLFCAFALAAGVRSQQVAPLAPPRAGFTFPQKQTLTYTVDWRVFPAGTAVLHFEATGDRERITANADTVGAINLLFHVSDKFQSTFDRNTGVPTSLTSRRSRGGARSTRPSNSTTSRANRFWTKRIW